MHLSSSEADLPRPAVSAAPQAQTQRLDGLDVARAFAVIGMVLVNFKLTMGAESGGPEWLHTLAALFDGRASATFVVLAGIGASLGSRRARLSGDPAQQRQARVRLLRRALFLFVLGWAFFVLWPADILHFYGIYLAIGAAVLFAPGRRLGLLAAGAAAISLTFVLSANPFAHWNLADYSYRGIATPSGFLRNLFFDGFHPVFPWIIFYLFGLWLGRTPLRDQTWRRRLVICAVAALAVAQAVSWIGLRFSAVEADSLTGQRWHWLFSVQPLPPLPLYLTAGSATAVLVICVSLWLTERLPRRVTAPLVSTGQLALTIYLAHVLVGMGLLEAINRLEHQSLVWAVLTSTAFSAAAIVFAWVWRRRFERGPLEALMRRLAG